MEARRPNSRVSYDEDVQHLTVRMLLVGEVYPIPCAPSRCRAWVRARRSRCLGREVEVYDAQIRYLQGLVALGVAQ